MSITILKRQCVLWSWALMGVVLLLVVGFSVALWMGEGHQDIKQQFNTLPWDWWRGLAYGVLLLFWPRLVNTVMHYRQSSLRGQRVSRRPLVVLIVLYECLIVQNPLAALFRLVG